jgi:hypothetical protein
MLNHVIQVLGPAYPALKHWAKVSRRSRGEEWRLSQKKKCPDISIECDILRDLMTADRFLEEAYGDRLIPILTQQEFAILYEDRLPLEALSHH